MSVPARRPARCECEFSDAERRSAHTDQAIAALAGRQHRVVELSQLTAIGYSARSVQRRVDRGLMIRRYPAVYVVGPMPLTVEGEWLAAVLACGVGTLLSHTAAAALHSLRTVPTNAIHVIAPGVRRLPGIVAHRHRVPESRRTVVDAIPVTTVEQTIADLAAGTSHQRLRTAIENGMRQEAIDFAVLRAIAAERAGRPGIPTLTAVVDELDDVAPRTTPGIQRELLALVRGDREIPEPQLNVVVEGLEVDFCWPATRVIAETDGWHWHRGRRSFEQDRRRDAVLTTAGWRVVRITARRLRTEPGAVLDQLRTLLTA